MSIMNSHRPMAPSMMSEVGQGVLLRLENRHKTRALMPTRLSELNASQIEVSVNNGVVETKKSLLANKHFLTYQVKIQQLRTDVRRRDEDFTSLHSYLAKAYPNVIVPPAKIHKPQKVLVQRYIEKRATLLTRFFKNSLRNTLLRGDKFLVMFLCEKDNKALEKGIKEMLTVQVPVSVANVVTEEGFVNFTEEEVDEINVSGVKKAMTNSFSHHQCSIRLHTKLR